MSRAWDGTDDVGTANPGPAIAASAARTLLAVMKNVSGTSWASLIEMEFTGAISSAIGRHSSGLLFFADSAANQTFTGCSLTSTTQAYVTGISDPGGSSAIVGHRIDVGGANINHVTGVNGTGSSTPSVLKVGGDDDFFNGLIACIAVFNASLSNTDWENIATNASSQYIKDTFASCVALYDDSNTFTSNLVNPGTYDMTLSGTTDSADTLGWTAGVGAAAAVIPELVMARVAA